jgi:hypothetical protein
MMAARVAIIITTVVHQVESITAGAAAELGKKAYLHLQADKVSKLVLADTVTILQFQEPLLTTVVEVAAHLVPVELHHPVVPAAEEQVVSMQTQQP